MVIYKRVKKTPAKNNSRNGLKTGGNYGIQTIKHKKRKHRTQEP